MRLPSLSCSRPRCGIYRRTRRISPCGHAAKRATTSGLRSAVRPIGGYSECASLYPNIRGHLRSYLAFSLALRSPGSRRSAAFSCWLASFSHSPSSWSRCCTGSAGHSTQARPEASASCSPSCCSQRCRPRSGRWAPRSHRCRVCGRRVVDAAEGVRRANAHGAAVPARVTPSACGGRARIIARSVEPSFKGPEQCRD